MEQCNAISCHSTAPLSLIAQSMDVHPNPGPTAIHIIRDLTTPHQRKLFNNAKRLQLKTPYFKLQLLSGQQDHSQGTLY